MIRRLRLKFICVNMVLVTAMLCAIFATVLRFTARDLEAESLRAMETAAEMALLGRPGQRPGESRLPCFVLQPGPRGELIAIGSGYYDLTDEAYLRDLLGEALGREERSGVLEDYGLRFLRSGPPDRPAVVFADISGERATMENLVRTCLLIGGGAFVAFLVLSVLLARWAAGPVERAWKQQRQFVADASHELKTPLTVILTNAELLQGGDQPAEARERFAGNILTMARQMRSLVEGLLELARVEGSLREEAMETVDWSRLASEAVLPFEPVFFERGLELVCQIEENIKVQGSGERLGQVLGILLDNAAKYAVPPGTVALRLERTAGRRCLLSVASPGPALTEKQRREVFRRFVRGDAARTGGGFGLGLSIAREIVRAHRGSIWAESGGEENVFRVQLPAVK